jgi:type IV pilus assembly protein PilB
MITEEDTRASTGCAAGSGAEPAGCGGHSAAPHPEEDAAADAVPGDEASGAALLERLKTPSIDLSLYVIEESTARRIPEEMARRNKLVPVFEIGRTLTVAMADPLDVTAIDEVQAHTGLRVEPVLAPETEIERVIEQYLANSGGTAGRHIAAPLDREASTISILNSILSEAVKQGASDVHIEPEEDFVRVRNRVDGVLKETMTLPKSLEPNMVARVKILAKLDIAEKRLPQDGRLQLQIAGRRVDIRVSIQPTVVGENVALRILDRESILMGTGNLGLSPDRQAVFERAIQRPFGMILVTGPTGSGKTTTLYSALNKISSPKLNIMTIEDPVEYRLDLIRQTQVNPGAGYTFANGLRALLRQDPDVIMVGEVRDIETAEIAIRSALTGHLVFSTLHTNDAAGAFARLLDMGIEPFLVASSLHCVVAQRLLRLICEKCKRPVEVPDYLALRLGIEDAPGRYWKGKGCRACRETGYKGRTGIFEVLPATPAVREAVMGRAPSETLREIAVSEGMRTLRQDGLEKALEGKTTLEEVLRVTTAGEEADKGRQA